MGIFGDEEPGEGLANRSLLGAENLLQAGPVASLAMVPMSKAEVMAGAKRRSRSPTLSWPAALSVGISCL